MRIKSIWPNRWHYVLRHIINERIYCLRSDPVPGRGALAKAIVAGYALRVQFFNPTLETRNSQQAPVTHRIGP